MSNYIGGLVFVKVFHNKGKHHMEVSTPSHRYGTLVLDRDTGDHPPELYGCPFHSRKLLQSGWCSECMDVTKPCRLLQEQHVAAARLKGEI